MIHHILSPFVTWQAKQVERSFMDPEATQRYTFRRLQRVLRQSELARSSGLIACQFLEDIRYLPATDSESLSPQLQRVFSLGDAERRVFGKSRLVAFARTSGTSGEPKDIPINQAYLKALDRSLVRVVASYLYCTKASTTFLQGRHVILASRPYIEDSPTGLPIVDISGFIPTRTWRAFRWLYIPKFKDLWIPDWSKRRDRALEQSVGKNVTTLSGIPALMKDFAKKARAKHHGAYLDEIWPNLTFYIFSAVPLPAREKSELRRQWFRHSHHTFYFVEAYFATEACLAHSFDPSREGLALNLLEYLFLFKERASDKAGLLAHELEVSKTYLLYVTTPGGLVNYAMGDKIKVLSTSPLLIQIVGREKDEISLTGEKITLEQLRRVARELNIGATEFVVWPAGVSDKPYLVWGLSDTHRSTFDDRLARRLDQLLSTYNTLYNEALTIEKVMAPSQVQFIPKKVFAGYFGQKLGIGQFKATQLFTSRDAFEAAFGWALPLSRGETQAYRDGAAQPEFE